MKASFTFGVLLSLSLAYPASAQPGHLTDDQRDRLADYMKDVDQEAKERHDRWRNERDKPGKDKKSAAPTGHVTSSGTQSGEESFDVDQYERDLHALAQGYMKNIEETQGTLDQAVGALPEDDISADPVVKACERALGFAVEKACGAALTIGATNPATITETILQKAIQSIATSAPCKLARTKLEEAIERRCESAISEVRGPRNLSPREQMRVDELVEARAREMANRRERAFAAARTHMMLIEQKKEEERQEASKAATSKASPTANSNCTSRIPVQITRAPNFD